MFKPGKDAALGIEARGMRGRIGVQQLDRGALRVTAIGALAAIHIAHPAASDAFANLPRPNAIASLQRFVIGSRIDDRRRRQEISRAIGR
ncbi:MAG: hypothetical protein ABI846_11525 [Rudaea sp.]